MYDWRKMTPEEQEATLEQRKARLRPWHSPPHRVSSFTDAYLITAACYEHRPFIGISAQRLSDFESRLLSTLEETTALIQCWVVLPNHYHALVRSTKILVTLKSLGQLHGKTSFEWNGEENTRGRQVWHGAAETEIKSDRHWYATINYVHHNPVKHEYVSCWQDWPYSSAAAYLTAEGRDTVLAQWKEYPIADYGKGWDD